MTLRLQNHPLERWRLGEILPFGEETIVIQVCLSLPSNSNNMATSPISSAKMQ